MLPEWELPLNGMGICEGSGIPSFVFESIGLSTTKLYIENESYCQQVIQQRIRDGWLPDAPIWDDLTTFDGRPWRGHIDFMFGGIPCTPWSVAGKRRGASDERDLWPAFAQVVRDVGPRLVLLENAPGLKAKSHAQEGLGRMLQGLAECGYHAEWAVFPASGVGAPHKRNRLWVVAYSNFEYGDNAGHGAGEVCGERCSTAKVRGCPVESSNTISEGLEGRACQRSNTQPECLSTERSGGQADEGRAADNAVRGRRGAPQGEVCAGRDSNEHAGGGTAQSKFCRVDDGLAYRLVEPGAAWPAYTMPPTARDVPDRKDRIKMIGNGWCVQQAAYIGLRIMQWMGVTINAA